MNNTTILIIAILLVLLYVYYQQKPNLISQDKGKGEELASQELDNTAKIEETEEVAERERESNYQLYKNF